MRFVHSSVFVAIFITSLTILSGCDLLDMPGETKDLDNKTNHLADTTDAMSKTTGDMAAGMDTTNHGIHLQTIGISIQNMFADSNTSDIDLANKLDIEQIVWAQNIAQEADADEAVQYIYSLLKEIDEEGPQSVTANKVAIPKYNDTLDPVMVNRFEGGKPVMVCSTQNASQPNPTVSATPAPQPSPVCKAEQTQAYVQDYSVDYVRKFNHDKLVKLQAALEIAGTIPQGEMIQDTKDRAQMKQLPNTMEAIVDRQITNHGEYESTVYKILALRRTFINTVVLKELYLNQDKGLYNLARAKQAVTYMERLQYIADLPNQDKINSAIAFSQFMQPSQDALKAALVEKQISIGRKPTRAVGLEDVIALDNNDKIIHEGDVLQDPTTSQLYTMSQDTLLGSDSKPVQTIPANQIVISKASGSSDFARVNLNNDKTNYCYYPASTTKATWAALLDHMNTDDAAELHADEAQPLIAEIKSHL